jgi:hypothetical protein
LPTEPRVFQELHDIWDRTRRMTVVQHKYYVNSVSWRCLRPRSLCFARVDENPEASCSTYPVFTAPEVFGHVTTGERQTILSSYVVKHRSNKHLDFAFHIFGIAFF